MSSPVIRRLAAAAACLAISLTGCNSQSSETKTPLEDEAMLRAVSGIRGLFEDRRGDLWVVSTEWLCRVDLAARAAGEDAFTYFPDISVRSMAAAVQEDADGRILVQDRTGLLVLRDGRFEPFEDGRGDTEAKWNKQEGDLWFGASRGSELPERERTWGVHRIRDGKRRFLSFPEPSGESSGGFYAMTAPAMPSPDGTLWFGTFEAAFGFNGESFDIIDRKRMGRGEDPRHVGLRNHYVDSRGLLWIADNGVGVYVYDGKDVTHFTALHQLRNEDTDGPPLDRSFSIGEDSDGTLWFGTAYSGAWRYRPDERDPIREGSFSRFGVEEGLPCQNIWMMYRTRAGELLFAGENPGGVYRFDGTRFERML